MESKDSLGYKIEALRYYLEKKMGLEVLLGVYKTLIDSSDEGDNHETLEMPLMKPEQEKFVPFVHHLVFCELNHFSNN